VCRKCRRLCKTRLFRYILLLFPFFWITFWRERFTKISTNASNHELCYGWRDMYSHISHVGVLACWHISGKMKHHISLNYMFLSPYSLVSSRVAWSANCFQCFVLIQSVVSHIISCDWKSRHPTSKRKCSPTTIHGEGGQQGDGGRSPLRMLSSPVAYSFSTMLQITNYVIRHELCIHTCQTQGF